MTAIIDINKNNQSENNTKLTREYSNDEISYNSTDTDDSLDLTNPHITRGEIQNIIGMKPRNLKYYRRAFVHKSVQRNVKMAKNINVLDYMHESNETMEFLGDSVLNLIVTNYLFRKFPNKNEGSLTRLKTQIVSRTGCAKFARELDLGRYILTSDVIKIDTYTDKILEDTFEALVAAIFIDLSFKYATVFIERLIDKYINIDELLIDRNYKDILIRYSQSQGYDLPYYEEIMKNGPTHNCEFTISVSLITNNNKIPQIAYGKGKSKKCAEQEAAKKLLNLLDQDEIYKFVNRDKYQ